jgi:hypothetical protein
MMYRNQLIGGFKNNIEIHRDDDELNDKEKIFTGDNQPLTDLSNIESHDKMTDSIDTYAITDTRDIGSFLKNNYRTNNGDHIIQGVIGPSNGQIQIWYLNTQCNQTESLIRVIRNELARNMDTKTLQKTFEQPIEVEKSTYVTKAWKPTKLLIEIPEDYEEEPIQGSLKKRHNSQIYYAKEISKNQDKNIDINVAETKHTTRNYDTNTNRGNNISMNNLEAGIETKNYDNQHQELKSDLEKYCKQLIEQSTNEMKKEIKLNTDEIRTVNTNSKNDINELKKTLIEMHKENKYEANQQKQDTKDAMENILNNQGVMMRYFAKLIGSKDNNNNTSRSHKKCPTITTWKSHELNRSTHKAT